MVDILVSSVFGVCVGVGVSSFFYAIKWAVRGENTEIAIFSGLVVLCLTVIISFIKMGWV